MLAAWCKPLTMYVFSDLLRRFENIFRIGTVQSVSGKRARVVIDGEDSEDIPWVVPRAGGNIDTDPPGIGEQVLVASMSGDRAQGIIIGSLYQDEFEIPSNAASARLRKFKDGSIISYDPDAKELKALLSDGATAEISAPGGTTFKGPVRFEDEVMCKKTLTADDTIKSKADIIDANTSMKFLLDHDEKHDHTAHNTPTTRKVERVS
jgi:phage baseplate assembly protein V